MGVVETRDLYKVTRRFQHNSLA